MAVNKVVYGNQTIIDLTSDTIQASHLFAGDTAHAADGTVITGTASITVDNRKLVMPLGLIDIPFSNQEGV